VVGVLPFYNDDSGKRLAQFVLIAALIEILGIALVVGGAWLLLMLLQLLGIKIPLFDSLAMKPRDIEFVLVEAPTAKPRHPTKNRAEHATRAGGQKVKNLNQAESHKAAGTPKPQKAARPAPTPQPQQRPQPQRPQQRPAVTQRPSQQPSQQPTPQPPTPRPTPRPPAPKLPVPKVANNTVAHVAAQPACAHDSDACRALASWRRVGAHCAQWADWDVERREQWQ
jgi:outer membrane biosynthesis protein TonB